MTPERVVFVHGGGASGAAAWPRQHGLSLEYDCLYVRRHGFSVDTDPVATDHERDQEIIADALGAGGHVVAHSSGAVSAMLLAVDRPELVRSLALVEPACLSLTAGLPATAAHIALMMPLLVQRSAMSDDEHLQDHVQRMSGTDARGPAGVEARREAARSRLESPTWEAPLTIVPGVPTFVLTGGWEPLYEEVAEYLAGTGAIHEVASGGHRPQDSVEGAALLKEFLRSVN